MKLWDSLTTCLILLSAVHAGPLPRSAQRFASKGKGRDVAAERPLELPPVQISLSVTSPGIDRAEADAAGWEESPAGGGKCTSLWFCIERQKCQNHAKMLFNRLAERNDYVNRLSL